MRNRGASQSMGSIVVAISLVAACLLVSPTRGGSMPVPEFSFAGTGWGHGIGLSQYGAMARASRGQSAAQIVKAYFSGVEITKRMSPNVRVNLDNQHSPRNSWRVRPGNAGGKIVVEGISYPDALYTFTSSSGKVVMTSNRGVRRAFSLAQVKISPGTGSGTLLEIYDASGPFNLQKIRYRGSFTVSTSGSRVHLVNNLNMEQYLYGVLPREIGSSSSIRPAAYKAQALAARSYAFRQIKSQGEASLWCTTKHQVYGGHSRWLSEQARSQGNAYPHESTYANAQVDSSRNQYITYKGEVISAYFSACNGNYTANSEDVWSTVLPYARSRKDSFCVHGHTSHSWMATMNGQELAARLKSAGAVVPNGAGSKVWVSQLVPTYDRGGHWVRSLAVRWSNGANTTLERGDNVRVKLGLRSAQFRVNRIVVDQVRRYEDGHMSIRKVGAWKRLSIKGSSEGAIRNSRTMKSYFEATFTGTGITWVGPKATSYGKARVYIDGQYKQTVSLKASRTVRQQPLYTIDGLDPKVKHTIRVMVTYSNATAKTVGYVALDALDVYNGSLVAPLKKTFNEDNSLIRTSAKGWNTIRSAQYSKGTAIVNSTFAQNFSTRFKGQAIVWYGRKSSTSGQAKVYLDGEYVKTVNLQSLALVRNARLYQVANLDPTKTHTLKVTVTHKKGSRSKTGGVTLDTLAVYDGTLVK